MRKRQILTGVLLLATVGLLAGCGGPAAPTEPVSEEAVPVVSQEAGDKVIAEGVIEPARWSELSFEGGGTVVEVLVEEGDGVSEGDLLVRLDPTDAELAVQEAEAALAAAKARLARVKAGPRPEEVAVAEARLEAARAAISQAAAQRDRLTEGETEADIAAVQAELARAMAEQRQAENLHDRTLTCFEFELPDGSESVICPALGRPEELSRFAMHAADAGLTAAQLQLEATQGRTEARLRDARAGVWSAAAQRDISQARLELMKAGSRPEEIASAEAEVAQAEASLAAAKVADERHCSEIAILDLRDMSPATDYFVIATGTSDRQMRTVADEISDVAREQGMKRFGRAGYEQARWILLDFIDVVIHIFDNEYRNYYDLELLWGDAKRLTIEH